MSRFDKFFILSFKTFVVIGCGLAKIYFIFRDRTG